ncbi:MAG: hypothetical protein K6E91_13645 [Butyrivibrio sp.]|nr:hypothetical protein [Butyrivibrio sp.]
MIKRKVFYALVGAFFLVLLSGCGASKEKLEEAQSAKSAMIEAKQKAEETYLDMVDSSSRGVLDDLAQHEAELEEVDVSKLNDKKIDELLPKLQEMTENYNTIGTELNQTLDKENEERKERLKHTSVDVFFVNKTGMDLKSIILHDTSADINSDNYIGDGVTLNSGYTLMGAQLDLYEDSKAWEFIVTDTNGTEYTLPSANLRDISEDGASIVLKYDSSSSSGSAEIGAYTAPAEQQEEISEEAASQDAAGSDKSKEEAGEAASAESSEKKDN